VAKRGLMDLQVGDVFEAGMLMEGVEDREIVWEVKKRREPPAGGVLLHVDASFAGYPIGRYAVKVEGQAGKEVVLWHKIPAT